MPDSHSLPPWGLQPSHLPPFLPATPPPPPQFLTPAICPSHPASNCHLHAWPSDCHFPYLTALGLATEHILASRQSGSSRSRSGSGSWPRLGPQQQWFSTIAWSPHVPLGLHTTSSPLLPLHCMLSYACHQGHTLHCPSALPLHDTVQATLAPEALAPSLKPKMRLLHLPNRILNGEKKPLIFDFCK